MATQNVRSKENVRYLRLLAAISLWFGLMLFIMAAVSLRRFTTPAASPADDRPPSVAAPVQSTVQRPVVSVPAHPFQPKQDSSRADRPAKVKSRSGYGADGRQDTIAASVQESAADSPATILHND